MPMRAVTGPGWTGREVDFRAAPDEYDAIHFHDDDLDDAGWATDFALEVAGDWPSGVYAAHLSAGDFDDYVPFVVRPPAGGSANRVALLLPTLTYMAYANEHMMGDYVTRRSPAYVAATDAVVASGTPYEAAGSGTSPTSGSTACTTCTLTSPVRATRPGSGRSSTCARGTTSRG